MIKRTLVFSNPIQLSLKNAQMVLSFKDMPNAQKTIPIEDIGIVIIEHQQVNVTIPLVNALADANVAVMICDCKGLPHAMVQNLDGNNLQGEMLSNQINVGEVLKKQLWKQLIEAKIKNQALLLLKLKKNADILKPLYSNVKSGDSDNREGIAAKLYWNELFGDEFTRDRNAPGVNALLNYGYTILRASTARALISSGLTPSLGIFHHNRSNAFPLADDIMEPYRPFVDMVVFNLISHGKFEITKETKSELIDVLYCDVHFEKITRPLQIGLSMTTASLSKCISGNIKKLNLPILQ
ncbi:MAG: type II CRISPR-associated endonuclease Cas1 [Paludibacteraceae bacterium]|nr:type II CRISPR-associated endonuclease Cas1 [Paludibacteraceae bacterium]